MAGLMKRGKKYYAFYSVGHRQKRVSLETTSLQIAKEKIRQIESALVRGVEIPLPTKTPIGDVVEAYIQHMKTTQDSPERHKGYVISPGGIRPDMSLSKNQK